MLRDTLARDHLEMLQESHDSTARMLGRLEERRRAGDDTVWDRRRYAADLVSLVTAMYSLGAGYDEMRRQARLIPEVLISTRDRLFDPIVGGDSLFTMLDVAAFVALFDDEPSAKQLITVVERFGLEDYLVDSYIGSVTEFRSPSPQLQMEVIGTTLGVKRPPLYGGQKEAAELALAGEHDKARDRLTRYVTSEWYSSHARDFDWNPPERCHFYVGHWSFTAAATAKVFGIDDSALHGHERYPWDLAHPT